jgi:Na+/H+ antiporter NhaA
MAAAAVALAWANSPWRAAYDAPVGHPLGFQLGRYAFHIDLRHWVNEGLMVLFFLVVGLEIKRELVVASWRAGAAPSCRWCRRQRHGGAGGAVRGWWRCSRSPTPA